MFPNCHSFPYIDDPIITNNAYLEGHRKRQHKEAYYGMDISVDTDTKQRKHDFAIPGLQFDGIQRPPRTTNSFLVNLPSDNHYSIKIFRNKYNLDKERERLKPLNNWIIHPCNNFRILREIVMAFVIAINLVIIPISISFYTNDLAMRNITLHCVCDLIMVIDIVFNFRTGIVKNEDTSSIILLPGLIVRHYSIRWFFLDLISSLPFDYIYILSNNSSSYSSLISAGRVLRILRIAKILGTFRLLRVFRLIRYVLNIERFLDLSNAYIPIINITLLSIIMVHFCASFQFFVPLITNFHENCWPQQIRILEESSTKQYLWSLFKAMSEMLSLSLGKYSLVTKGDQFTSIVTRITGAILSTVFVAQLLRLIVFADFSKTIYIEKLSNIKTYMDQNNLPKSLQMKVIDYYQNRYRGLNLDESLIVDQLSYTLKQEIMNIRCGEMLKKSSLLSSSDLQFLASITGALRLEIALPGEWVFKEGTIGSKMFFVEEGIVDIITRDGELIRSLSEGGNIGELCLLSESIRLASGRAKTHCRLYSLDRDKFLTVLDSHPISQKYVEAAAEVLLTDVFSNSTWRNLSRIWRTELNYYENGDRNTEYNENGGQNNGMEFQIRRIIEQIKRKPIHQFLKPRTNDVQYDLDGKNRESSL